MFNQLSRSFHLSARKLCPNYPSHPSQAATSCFAGLSSGSITMYGRLPHLVDAMCRSLAAADINAECPSGKAPTTRVRLRISRIIRSSGLLTGMISASAERPCQTAYDVPFRDRGTGSTIRGQADLHTMSFELELLNGHSCDLPGCAESANP